MWDSIKPSRRQHVALAFRPWPSLPSPPARFATTVRLPTWTGTTSTNWNDASNFGRRIVPSPRQWQRRRKRLQRHHQAPFPLSRSSPPTPPSTTSPSIPAPTSPSTAALPSTWLGQPSPTTAPSLISLALAPSIWNFTANTLLTGTEKSSSTPTPRPMFQITAAAGVTITNDTTHTIDGVGTEVDAALINNGTVNADSPSGPEPPLLQTSNMTNNNLFEATAGATMNISGITVTQGANGTISGAGGTVNMTGVTINGGTIGGSVNVNNSTFNNLKIAANTTISRRRRRHFNYGGPPPSPTTAPSRSATSAPPPPSTSPPTPPSPAPAPSS